MNSAVLHQALSLISPRYIVAGTLAGYLVGIIPGLGPAAGITLLLPLTYYMSPAEALIFYASLYQSAEYSGSITAIAVSTPGTPNAAATVLDGFAMNREGKIGKAFAYSLWSTAVFASLKKSHFSAPALVVGFILGPIIETNVRRVLLLSSNAGIAAPGHSHRDPPDPLAGDDGLRHPPQRAAGSGRASRRDGHLASELGAEHDPSLSVVDLFAVVHGAAIVPDEEIAGLPDMRPT